MLDLKKLTIAEDFEDGLKGAYQDFLATLEEGTARL